MKQNLLFVAFLVSAFLVFGFSNLQSTKHLAEPTQIQGVTVFCRCKPVDEYTYLGTYKIKISLNNKPETLFDQLVKKSKDKFPDESAIIVSDDMESCDCIKWK